MFQSMGSAAKPTDDGLPELAKNARMCVRTSDKSVLKYEYLENPPEYIFEREGVLYLTQPRMRGAAEVFDVYETATQLCENVRRSETEWLDVDELDEDLREKIEDGWKRATKLVHPSP